MTFLPFFLRFSTSITGLLRGLAIALVMGLSTVGALATDLAGKEFDILVMQGKGHQMDHLAFSATELTWKGGGKLPYTAVAKKGSSAMTFTATLKDSKGGTTVIKGEFWKTEVHGSITYTPKEGPPVAVNFTSNIPNSPPGKTFKQ